MFLNRAPHRTSTSRRPGLALILAAPIAAVLVAGIAAFISSAAADESSFELGGDAARARPDYEKYCAPCHGPKGEGDGPMGEYLVPQPKDLTNAEYMETRSDEQLYLAITEGGAEVGLSDKMAPWKHLLSDQQIRDLAAYVRTLSEPSE